MRPKIRYNGESWKILQNEVELNWPKPKCILKGGTLQELRRILISLFSQKNTEIIKKSRISNRATQKNALTLTSPR